MTSNAALSAVAFHAVSPHACHCRQPDRPASPELSETMALRDRVATLEEAAERRWLLVAAAGHDLRQPLQIILRAAEKLAGGGRQDSAFWLDTARAQIDRMVVSLDRLVQESRNELRAGRRAPGSVDLGMLLADIACEFAPAAAEKGLVLRMTGAVGTISGDVDALRTIIANLVGNAVKYADRGGVKLVCRHMDGGTRIDVIDTGCGFEEGGFDMLRQPFVQADPATQGLGLGLWLVDRLCATAGVRLTCRSRRGLGSRFRLLIPR